MKIIFTKLSDLLLQFKSWLQKIITKKLHISLSLSIFLLAVFYCALAFYQGYLKDFSAIRDTLFNSPLNSNSADFIQCHRPEPACHTCHLVAIMMEV